jgi:hypothetical protein
MIEFLAGLIIGAAVLAFVVSKCAQKAQEPAQKAQGFAAVGMDLNRNGRTVIETGIPTNLLKQVFRNLEIGRG